MPKDNVKLEFKADELERLIKRLKSDKVLRIGIIGSKAHSVHSGSSLTNAEIGTIHEFGSDDGKHPPRRSFLLDPLTEKLNFKNQDMKAIKSIAWKSIFKTYKPDKFLLSLGAKAMSIIEGAFLTAGYGNWKPLAPSSMKAFRRQHGIPEDWMQVKSDKKWAKWSDMQDERTPLVDTGKLKGSISFKLIKK